MASEVPPDIEQVLVRYLSPLGKVSTKRKAGDPLPQWLVHRVAGADTPEMAQDVASVSIHTFAASKAAAAGASADAHEKMIDLVLNPLTEIVVGAVTVGIDYCRVLMAPTEIDYQDPNITRYVARYEVGLPYISS